MTANTHMLLALSAANASARLQAALAIGSAAFPDAPTIAALLDRCRVEPDFFVRDMLTWALCRFPAELTVPALVTELASDVAQARSQALHTLSKIKDRSAFSAITTSLLRDADDEVARSAWRAAVVLAPDEEKGALAETLASQLGRGSGDVQLSLSRALVALGESLIQPVLERSLADQSEAVRAHAGATRKLLLDPDAGSTRAVQEAKRQFLLKDRPA